MIDITIEVIVVSLNQFQDDFALLSCDFYCFLRYYEIKKNEINDKFHYVFTYTETNDSFFQNFNKCNQIESNQNDLIQPKSNYFDLSIINSNEVINKKHQQMTHLLKILMKQSTIKFIALIILMK